MNPVKIALALIISILSYIVYDINREALALDSFKTKEYAEYAIRNQKENIVRSSCDVLTDCLEFVEKQAGSRINWFGATKIQPAYIYVRIRQNYDASFRDVETSLERVLTVMLVVNNEQSVNALPVLERYTKIREYDLAYLERAKYLTAKLLEPYKRSLEKIATIKDYEEILAYKAPKMSTDELTKKITEDDLAFVASKGRLDQTASAQF